MTGVADPFDELTALFLTTPDAPSKAHAAGSEAGAAMTELLLVGHLPVRAGLWLGPYADAIARASGPVALLRLDGDPSIEVMRGQADAARALDRATLQESVGQLGGSIRTWMVRPPAATTPAQALQAGADRVTVLTGADEAAVVAAYKLVKDLADAAGKLGRALPPIGLAVLGCPRATALAVLERLNRTVSTFLGFDLVLTACVPQMDAGIRSTAFHRFMGHEIPGLPALTASISRARTATREPMRPLGRTSVAAHEPMREPPRPQPVRNDPPWGAAPVKLAPRVAIQASVEPAAPPPQISAGSGSLSSHLPELTILPVQCPQHPQVELAIDAAGGLHLLAREGDLRSMQVAAAWAMSHRVILALACRDQRLAAAAAVVQHVFTAAPHTVADLHGSGLRLHVLAPVKVGDQTAWYVAPLNQP